MDPLHQAAQSAPSASSSSPPQGSGWKISEVMFFLVLIFALAAVVYCGRFAYREGSLLEEAKANAQAIARWAEARAASPTPLLCGAVNAAGVSENNESTKVTAREESGATSDKGDKDHS